MQLVELYSAIKRNFETSGKAVASPGVGARRGTTVTWCLHEATVNMVTLRLRAGQSALEKN